MSEFDKPREWIVRLDTLTINNLSAGMCDRMFANEVVVKVIKVIEYSAFEKLKAKLDLALEELHQCAGEDSYGNHIEFLKKIEADQ